MSITRTFRPAVRLLSGWLPALLFIVFSGALSKCEALGIGYRRAFAFELQHIIDRHPHYLWGGAEDEREGLDCSGYVYLAARRAGLNGRRTTARRMGEGDNGWDSTVIRGPGNSRHCDLVFWTLKATRPNGHVGVRWYKDRVTHSSSSRGVVVDRFKGYWVKHLTRIRRLTQGD